MGDYLFINSKVSNRLRLFRLGSEWHECFVVEFLLGANDYEHLYWGNRVYDEESRSVISDMLTMTFLSDSHDEWKKVNLERLQNEINYPSLLSKIEDEIKKNV